MSPELLLAIIIGVPIIALMVLRINAVLVFLSLCLGDVLVQFVAPDMRQFITLFASSSSQLVSASKNTLALVLLLFPVVLTAVFMIRSVKSHARLLLNLLPAVGVGLLGALLTVPLMSPGLHYAITDTSLWQQVERAQDLIVGSSALVCLLVLWLQRPKFHSHNAENKHGKHHSKE